MSMQVYKHAQG